MKQSDTDTGTAGPPAAQDSPLGEYLSGSRAIFLLVALTVLVYANSLGGEFVFDDTKQIVNNQGIHSWGNMFKAFTTDVWAFESDEVSDDTPPPYYRPLFTVYLTVGYKLFGLWEPGWHLFNVLAHAGATVLVYLLLMRLTGRAGLALLAGLIFGVHPAHTESVAWISAIPDPMMALFYVPALIWYDRYREGGAARDLWLAAAAYAVAVFCKETAISLPVLLCCWEAWRGDWRKRGGLTRAAVALAPFAVVSAVYLAARFAVLGRLSWKHPGMLMVPDHLIDMTVPFALASYLYHLVLPFDLSIVYGTSFVRGAGDPRFYVPALVLSALGAALWVFRRRLPREAWLALLFLVVPLLPVLNLKALHQEYMIQDRYLYLPLIGFGWLAAAAVCRVAEARRAAGLGLGALLVVALSAGTIVQNRVWHDSVALWQQALEYAPDYWSTHYNLGLAYLHRREYAAAQANFESALEIEQRPVIYNNLALAQIAQGRADAAVGNLRHALALRPQFADARNNLGAIMYERGDYRQAREQFAQAVEAEPAAVSARFNLARAEASLGDHAAAAGEFERLRAKRPEDAEIRYQLALSYAARGRRAEAIAELKNALAYERNAERAAEVRGAYERISKTP